MEGLIPEGTEFAKMVAATDACGDLTVFDVGCSGGIDLAWRCFGHALVAFGFDPNLEECARLSSIETHPRVEYVAEFVGLPSDHDFLKRRGSRPPVSRSPWNRLSVQRSIEIRQRRVANMTPEQLRDLNLWAKTRLADPAKPLTLTEFAKGRNISDVDFVKIDVDGEDFAILNSIGDCFDAWGVLGVGLEVNFFGSDNDTDHTFHNMDRFMRRHGFDLFNLTPRRYSHEALPSRYVWHNPSETVTGRPLQGDAIYLHDVCSEENGSLPKILNAAKLLKLAAIASLAETPDTAAQILAQFRDRVEGTIDVPRALDLLAQQTQARLGLRPRLPYRKYIDAFEADAPSFYTSPPTADRNAANSAGAPNSDREAAAPPERPDADAAPAGELRANLAALRTRAAARIRELETQAVTLLRRSNADAARVRDLEARLAALLTSSDRDADRIAELEAEAVALRGASDRARRLQAEVAALLGSSSWRITAPLRALAARIRRQGRHRAGTRP